MIASKPSNDLNGQTEGRLNHDDHHVVHDRSLIKEVTSKQAPEVILESLLASRVGLDKVMPCSMECSQLIEEDLDCVNCQSWAENKNSLNSPLKIQLPLPPIVLDLY